MRRHLLALLSLLALALGGVHASAMASMPQPPATMVSSMDCHAAPGKPGMADDPAEPACCPDGQCFGQCAAVAALLASAPQQPRILQPSSRPLPGRDAPPSASVSGLERPPRIPA